ncbi:FBD domain-containing protein [Heracleum sosnowskyi]|uniref:FBD domain-containing protein n=1 Tax=Heracleum sosnowskyi TaxID=360622 RepID=A0AAD8GX54_9APIA|nr:FBD domain-containing protein [Heracleum sosnowskyi]
MGKSSKRKVQYVNKDRISEMPWDIQEIIICFLPICDAVRTSILSKNWRHSWTKIPHLIFDDEFLCRMKDKLREHDYNYRLRGGWEKGGQYRYHSCLKAQKFVSVIENVLELHNAPILKFSLRFPKDCDAQIISDRIGQWILLFSKKGIKQLTLDTPDTAKITPHDFSSLDLTHLRLTRVRFPSRLIFGEFTCLTEIELFQVTNFGQHIYKCPVLEKLTLLYCGGLSPINFHAPNLRCIHEISGEITLSWLENLKEYSFGLTHFCWPTDTKTSNLAKVLGSLHNIEKFSIGIFFIRYLAEGGCPDRLPNPMPCLKVLNIYDINFAQLSEILCLLCLIRSAPNLFKLQITVRFEKNAVEGNLKNYWDKVSEDCAIGQLETVTLCKLRGLGTELELIKFILAHSPFLKTMFIHYSRALEKDETTTMSEKVLQYAKTSSRAQLIHLEEVPIHFYGY